MFGSVKTYGFINAKLRARISRFLSGDELQRLIRTRSLAEALALLRETAFSSLAEIYAGTGDLKLIERELLKREITLYTGIRRSVSGILLDVVDSLILRYEIDNLKNALRFYFERTIRGRPVDDSVHYLIHEDIIHRLFLDQIINATTPDDILGALHSTPYAVCIEHPLRELQTTGTLFQVELSLDRYFYRQVIETIEKLQDRDRNIARRFIGIEIDMRNIHWIFRNKSYYHIPAGELFANLIEGPGALNGLQLKEIYETNDIAKALKTGSRAGFQGLGVLLGSAPAETPSRLRLIETVLEQILLGEVRRIMAGYPFTIGILFCYFVLAERETARVRTILNAKNYEIAGERIEAMI